MKRRTLLPAGLGAPAACGQSQDRPTARSRAVQHNWYMVTSWPPNLHSVIATACMAESEFTIAEFAARNQRAPTLVNEHGAKLRRFADDVSGSLARHTDEAITDRSSADPVLGRVYAAYDAHGESIGRSQAISEGHSFRLRA
jgi:TRAP-type mannitol/chloroaromatic compound transport system substrate-binding protein